MKIMMIGWGFKENICGGMDVHVTHLTASLCSQGAKVHLFLPKENAPDHTCKNLTIHRINIDTSTEDTTKLIKHYNDAIIRRAQSIDFDIIHSHDWLGVPAAKKLSKNKPWVHTVHSLEYMRCAKDTLTKGAIADIEKSGIIDSDAIITVSRLMKHEICRSFNIEPKKTSIIYNYTSQLPKTTRHPTATPTVLCVSRLTFQKGIEYLVYASKDILKEIPDCRFIIVGDGYLKKSLENFAKTLNVYSSFEFRGFVPKNELAACFNSAGIFIMPSIHEPFGIACLDAIDFGLPVILSENVGAKELFDSCVLVHKPGSSKSITEKTLKLLKDKELSDNLRNRAKEKLNKIDKWEKIAKKVLETYASV